MYNRNIKQNNVTQTSPLFKNCNEILQRETISQEIKKILLSFDDNIHNPAFKKGIYIYGATGCGKTHFVMDLLKEMDYDIIKYDAGDVRNKGLIDTITSNNITNRNVLQMMNRKVKKIVIVMDEIDGMNNGDKGGITSLIKLIRQKKTKKQKLENITLNPIICIGNYYTDKKMKELMKVCNIFELKKPDNQQIMQLMKNHNETNTNNINGRELRELLLYYIQGDLRKLIFICNLFEKKPELINANTIKKILHLKSYNEDVKKITQHLIVNHVPIEKHDLFMNETDRTILALLWHENIVDTISTYPKQKSIPFYMKILDNMCYADYIDRITFQNQIWQFNEMSSLMKTFYNNKLFHETFTEVHNKFNSKSNNAIKNHKVAQTETNEIRFTKVLTKYSTEYNNILFIYEMCKELDMDKRDLLAFFQELRLNYGKEFYNNLEIFNNIEKIFEGYNISKLDIKRIYRYLDKNVKKVIIEPNDDDLEIED